MVIGTTAAMVMGSLAGAAIQGGAAKSAARSQERGAEQQLAMQERIAGEQTALQERIYGETRESFDPFLQAGRGGLGAYQYELGLGERPEGYAGIQESPAFQRQLEMGVRGIESGAAARGKLFSGATGTALERYRSGLASQEVGNYMNRLAGMTQMGQASAGMQASAGQNFAGLQAATGANLAAGGASSLANLANAQAAGAVGMGNALTSGINTGMGLYGYLNQPQTAASTMTTPVQRPPSFY